MIRAKVAAGVTGISEVETGAMAPAAEMLSGDTEVSIQEGVANIAHVAAAWALRMFRANPPTDRGGSGKGEGKGELIKRPVSQDEIGMLDDMYKSTFPN